MARSMQAAPPRPSSMPPSSYGLENITHLGVTLARARLLRYSRNWPGGAGSLPTAAARERSRMSSDSFFEVASVATATDASGNTSEFSQGRQVQ